MMEKEKTGLRLVAERLRAMAIARADGDLLGSEDAIVAELGASKSTVRQAARLLEQEGIVRVRRGPSGGYFATRPDASVLQQILGTYLATVSFDPEEVTEIASALWIVLVRKAVRRVQAGEDPDFGSLEKRLKATRDNAGFEAVRQLEEAARAAIFRLADSRYVELIFRSNIVFANRAFAPPAAQDDKPEHRSFVVAWRDAKLIELAAIARGDEELSVLTAGHVRSLWHGRVWLNRSQTD